MARKKAVGTSRFTPSRARNAMAVAKVVGPALVPVLTPYALRAAAVVRDGWDRAKARRMGVDVGDLAQFTGRGAALHARIAGTAAGLADLRAKPGPTAEERSFADDAEVRLRQLAAVVRAAERMPTARRRAAHRAVDAELSSIEGRLLRALGV